MRDLGVLDARVASRWNPSRALQKRKAADVFEQDDEPATKAESSNDDLDDEELARQLDNELNPYASKLLSQHVYLAARMHIRCSLLPLNRRRGARASSKKIKKPRKTKVASRARHSVGSCCTHQANAQEPSDPSVKRTTGFHAPNLLSPQLAKLMGEHEV